MSEVWHIPIAPVPREAEARESRVLGTTKWESDSEIKIIGLLFSSIKCCFQIALFYLMIMSSYYNDSSNIK